MISVILAISVHLLGVGHCAKSLYILTHLILKWPYVVVTMTIPILQMRKWRARDDAENKSEHEDAEQGRPVITH